MTTNEIKLTLAEYDGFKHYDTEYLTDLNILHRVAVKVFSELIDSPCHDDISDLTDRCSNISNALTKLPINGEYTTLATATAEAIVYLSKHKV
jgi:hypothetical protein